MADVIRHIVLLRGINLVRTNRIAMAELRAALEADGFRDVATYLQSGNVVLSSGAPAASVARRVKAVITHRFGFDIVVLVRSRDELGEVLQRNPLRDVAHDPKRHLVTFLSAELPDSVVERVRVAAGQHEAFAVNGREVYSWHPAGVGRSPLWERLAAKVPGVAATTRNWSTVKALHQMARVESTG